MVGDVVQFNRSSCMGGHWTCQGVVVEHFHTPNGETAATILCGQEILICHELDFMKIGELSVGGFHGKEPGKLSLSINDE